MARERKLKVCKVCGQDFWESPWQKVKGRCGPCGIQASVDAIIAQRDPTSEAYARSKAAGDKVGEQIRNRKGPAYQKWRKQRQAK